jgi:hypothetical protein
MRLHTNFRDYYDTAIGYGIDENVHYNRIANKVNIQIKSKRDLPTLGECGLLGFCGQVYPILKMERSEWEGAGNQHRIVERYFAFSVEDYVGKYAEWNRSKYFHGFYEGWRLKLKQYFTDWSCQRDDIFLEFKVPSWIFWFQEKPFNAIVNPRLADYGFDRIKDAVTTFQEISMYLSNILVEQKDVAAVEDRYRVTQHGFDLKTSFRNVKE